MGAQTAEARAAQAADKEACQLRAQHKSLGLKAWRQMVETALAKMPAEQAQLVKEALKRRAGK
jgi:hypothetical protein